jgi:hypothetical protein
MARIWISVSIWIGLAACAPHAPGNVQLYEGYCHDGEGTRCYSQSKPDGY